MHEAPTVPFYGRRETGDSIVAGMVLNIEPVVSLGSAKIVHGTDGWSYVTTDGSPTAQFEHTVAVLPDHTEPLSLTRAEIIGGPSAL